MSTMTTSEHNSHTKSIKYLYGEFPVHQLEEHKKRIHSSIHWLLVYKDPETAYQWKEVDVDKYLNVLLLRLGGLNELFGCPEAMVTLISVLEAVRIENAKENFDWRVYRKLVLDAQNLVECLPGENDEGR